MIGLAHEYGILVCLTDHGKLLFLHKPFPFTYVSKVEMYKPILLPNTAV